jgi:hypothetical protein
VYTNTYVSLQPIPSFTDAQVPCVIFFFLLSSSSLAEDLLHARSDAAVEEALDLTPRRRSLGADEETPPAGLIFPEISDPVFFL